MRRCGECALNTFREEFAISLEADTRRVERTGDGVRISWIEAGEEHQETFDYLLAATGRRPNVDHLDIQNAGIELDDRGMPVFDPFTLRCGDSHIFIAGDANNNRPLLHEAADEGRIAGDNAGTWPEVRAGLRKTPMSVVFTDPQVASVGLNIHQVGERCQGCFAIGEVSFEGQGRSKVIGRNRGLLRVYGEHGSGLFMGAQMFGPAAEHHCSPAGVVRAKTNDCERNAGDAVLPSGNRGGSANCVERPEQKATDGPSAWGGVYGLWARCVAPCE